MERLTRKSDTSDMVWFIDREHKSGYAEREPCDMDAHHARLAIAKLAEYEDLEEQGELLKLPCAVGDTVYRICPKCNDSHNGSCKNCAWENSCSNRGCTVYGVWKDGQYPMGECTIVPYKVFWNYIPNLLENIGKRVFLTREEAEAALKELEGRIENTFANT